MKFFAPLLVLLSLAPAPGWTAQEKLIIKDLKEGAGLVARSKMEVTVDYTGWIWKDGQRAAKFDSSVDRGVPFSFVLGKNMVIPGWEKGIQGMKVGGQRELIIPPQLGYGERGAGASIPPNSTLDFEVKLLSVKEIKSSAKKVKKS